MNFYEDCKKLIYCNDNKTKEIINGLCDKYNISQETVYYRIRTYFGDKLRNLRFNFFEPTKEEFIKNLLLTNNKDEIRSIYKDIPDSQWLGIYDRVMGVSTYQKSRLLAEQSLRTSIYNPSIYDNKALIAAIILGDGSYDKLRKAIRIEHCIKQKCWLEKKIELIIKAFPYLYNKISITKRNTARWYSGKITSKKYLNILEQPKQNLPQYLNEFGLWVLFLDDGCNSDNSIDYAVENSLIGSELIKKLSEYNIPANQYTEHSISIKKELYRQRFYNNILLPFSNITPQCMEYKIISKI